MNSKFMSLLILCVCICKSQSHSDSESNFQQQQQQRQEQSEESLSQGQGQTLPPFHTIEGRVTPPSKKPPTDWLTQTQILVNSGEHIGLLKEDGTFVITGLPAGSHMIEVVNPQLIYESARVDITSRGKIRARKVNHLQPSQVSHLPYPLRLTTTGFYRYFQVREQWRVTDVLLSPMVLMMVLPLVLIVILPKMMSDPETRREMEQVSLPKYEMPEMSEMLTSFFGGGKDSGGDSERKGQKSIKSKKNN